MMSFIDTPIFVVQAVKIIHFLPQVYTGIAQYAGCYDGLDFLYKS